MTQEKPQAATLAVAMAVATQASIVTAGVAPIAAGHTVPARHAVAPIRTRCSLATVGTQHAVGTVRAWGALRSRRTRRSVGARSSEKTQSRRSNLALDAPETRRSCDTVLPRRSGRSSGTITARRSCRSRQTRIARRSLVASHAHTSPHTRDARGTNCARLSDGTLHTLDTRCTPRPCRTIHTGRAGHSRVALTPKFARKTSHTALALNALEAWQTRLTRRTILAANAQSSAVAASSAQAERAFGP